MTFGIRVTVTGVDSNIEQLAAIAGAIPAELPDQVQSAIVPIYYAMANYDAAALPSYTRTFAMQDSVYAQVESSGDMVTANIGGNEELYWTRGTATGSYGGAYAHIGRWRTMKDIADTLIPVAEFRIGQLIDALIKRIRG